MEEFDIDIEPVEEKVKEPVIYKKFEDIGISTQTIIAVSNININLSNLYKYLPITDYIVIPKRRGRKKRVATVNPNIDVPMGSIIFVKYKTNFRGVVVKAKKSKSTKYFLNSVTVELILENEKIINMKISSNGKFQITGCKDNNHFISCLRYLVHHMNYAQKYTGESIYTVTKGETIPKIIFNVVMKNKDFKINFDINSQKLDLFINENTDFISLYENNDDKTSYVNIKYPLKKKYEDTLNCINFDMDKINKYNPYKSQPNFVTITHIDNTEYLKYENDTKKKKEDAKVKQKYHTFLVFQSGAIIQSGCGPEMEEVYNKFINIIINNRNDIEEVVC